MQSLEEVYSRLNAAKKERRELNKMLKDEMLNNARHQEVVEEMKTLREEKKGIEQEIRSASADPARLDELKLDIQTDVELLSDIALNLYMKNETVEIEDEYGQTWYPQFKVAFKKS